MGLPDTCCIATYSMLLSKHLYCVTSGSFLGRGGTYLTKCTLLKGKNALGTNTTWLGFGKDPGLGYITMTVVVVKRNQMLAVSSEQEMNSCLCLMFCLPIQPPYL